VASWLRARASTIRLLYQKYLTKFKVEALAGCDTNMGCLATGGFFLLAGPPAAMAGTLGLCCAASEYCPLLAYPDLIARILKMDGHGELSQDEISIGEANVAHGAGKKLGSGVKAKKQAVNGEPGILARPVVYRSDQSRPDVGLACGDSTRENVARRG